MTHDPKTGLAGVTPTTDSCLQGSFEFDSLHCDDDLQGTDLPNDTNPSDAEIQQRIQQLHHRLYDPGILVFTSILNVYLPQGGRKRQQELANSIGLVSAALSHYRVGRRTPSIEIVHAIANALDLSVEQEQHLISAWFFDREVFAIRAYFDAIVRDKAYDRLGLVAMRLDQLYKMNFPETITCSQAADQ